MLCIKLKRRQQAPLGVDGNTFSRSQGVSHALARYVYRSPDPAIHRGSKRYGLWFVRGRKDWDAELAPEPIEGEYSQLISIFEDRRQPAPVPRFQVHGRSCNIKHGTACLSANRRGESKPGF